VRHRSSCTDHASRRSAIIGVLATFAGFALLGAGVAAAATHTTNFEDLRPGSVDGQDGWKTFPDIDEAVVPSGGILTFGQQSLRMSNLFTSGAFYTQTYSTAVVPPAGETQPNTVYTAKFSFADPEFQKGLQLTVSPDNGEGGRMSWVRLLDQPDGVHVDASDSPGSDGGFAYYDLGKLSHGQPHTIEFRIKVVAGEVNDRVRILIDDQDVGQCFTTWETFYREQQNLSEPLNIDRLQFRSGGAQGPPELAESGGYLFDNVTVTTGTGSASPGCDVTIDKQADASTVRAGGLVGYRITAQNRGRAVARNVRVCDRIPRRTTFVRADRRLQRVGHGRCLVIPSLRPGQRERVHVVLRVDADHPLGTLTNIADVRPGLPGTSPPPGVDLPVVPGAPARGTPAAKVRAVKRAKAIVRVLARRGVRRSPVTG